MSVEELASQWPIVALVLVIVLGAGRLLQAQYEARIKDARDDRDFWRELALTGTTMAERLTDAVERHTRQR